MSGSDDETWVSERLAELECLYRETRNPLFAWQAFLDCCPPDKPLPSWIRDYLRGCAASWLTEGQPPWRWPKPGLGSSSKPGHMGLLDLSDAVRDEKRPRDRRALDDHPRLSPEEAFRAVPRALGLTDGSNRNAFAEARDRELQAAVVAHYEGCKRKGSSDADLLAMADNLGKSPATLKRWLGTWRGLWETQRKAKDAFARRGK